MHTSLGAKVEVEATLRPDGEADPSAARPLRSGDSPMSPALCDRCSGRPSRSAAAAALLNCLQDSGQWVSCRRETGQKRHWKQPMGCACTILEIRRADILS